MSESNLNPDEIEEKTIELPEGYSESDFINDEEAPASLDVLEESPAEETPPPETPKDDTPAVTRVPPLFADVTDPAERRALIEDALASMEPAERVSLKGVAEYVDGARRVGESEGEHRARLQIEQQTHASTLEEATNILVDRIEQYAGNPAFKLQEEIQPVVQAAAEQRQNAFVSAMSNGLGAVLRDFGITSLPDELVQRVNAVDASDPANFAHVIYNYASYLVQVGAEGGKALQSQDYQRQQEADAIALRARSKNEALGQLAKDGRIRISRDAEGLFATLINDTPPPINGEVPAGAVTVDEAEWELAMRDVDAYDRLMANPGKRAFIESLTAEAVGARR